ncbi:ABC transporter substrate-binding protein [Rhodococcus sp. NPDC003318]|uniref:ABC transporter substrate-binding protein n=1 Tax=Rhodococcus sp. NPDC003318 TaxID=3364503 RepID=UPI003684AC33
MPTRSGRSLAALAVAGLLAFAVTACGGSSSADSSGPGEIDRDATLTLGAPNRTSVAFNPLRYIGPNYGMWNSFLYDAMIHDAPDGGLEPGLAESWSYPDASTMRITLRPDLKFQDGTALNAEAVKYNWDRVIKTPAGVGPGQVLKDVATAAMESVTVEDPRTVAVHFSKPDLLGIFLGQLRGGPSFVLSLASPKALEGGDEAYEKNPVGAGPYKFVEMSNESVTLERWDGYWNPDQQLAAKVKVAFVPVDGAQQVNAVASGKVDAVGSSVAVADSAKAAGAQVAFVPPVTEMPMYSYLCATKAPFDKLEARQALEYAIDREQFVQPAFSGYGSASDKVTAKAFKFAPTVESSYSYDPAKAKKLLTDAGLVGSKVNILVDPDSSRTAAAQVLQTQLNAVGFSAEVKVVESAFAAIRSTPWNLVVNSGPNVLGTLSTYLLPGGGGNACNNNFPQFNDALGYLLSNPGAPDAEQQEGWNNLQKAIWDEAALLSIGEPDQVVLHDEKVGGVVGDIADGYMYDLLSVYVKK